MHRADSSDNDGQTRRKCVQTARGTCVQGERTADRTACAPLPFPPDLSAVPVSRRSATEEPDPLTSMPTLVKLTESAGTRSRLRSDRRKRAKEDGRFP